MAYSRRWFRYSDDSGNDFAIQADESNVELINDVASTAANVNALNPLPKGIRPRSVYLQNPDGTIARKIPVLTQAQYAALNVGANYTLLANAFHGVQADTPVQIRRKDPELERRQPFTGDTQLIDGDNP